VWNDKGASLDELRNEWSYEDVMKANAVLDMSQAINLALDLASERENATRGNSR
jgi:hypothetical protein